MGDNGQELMCHPCVLPKDAFRSRDTGIFTCLHFPQSSFSCPATQLCFGTELLGQPKPFCASVSLLCENKAPIPSRGAGGTEVAWSGCCNTCTLPCTLHPPKALLLPLHPAQPLALCYSTPTLHTELQDQKRGKPSTHRLFFLFNKSREKKK